MIRHGGYHLFTTLFYSAGVVFIFLFFFCFILDDPHNGLLFFFSLLAGASMNIFFLNLSLQGVASFHCSASCVVSSSYRGGGGLFFLTLLSVVTRYLFH